MSERRAKDFADRQRDGDPIDIESDAEPVNAAARAKAMERPRTLTVRQLLETSRDRALSTERIKSCTTGVHELDEITGGLRAGEVWVFGAESSYGKSSFLVMVADENLKAGKRVLIVTSEDDHTVYGDRLMCRRARVNATRLRKQNLNPEERAAVERVASAGEPLPVYLDARGLPAELVCVQVENIIQRHNIDFVGYDYLQEFRTKRIHKDRRLEVAASASMLRMTLKRCGITGIIFSQITMEDPSKMPTKHSIRESKDVPNGAEVVVLGYMPQSDVERDGRIVARAGVKYIFADKVKQGPPKRFVEMSWDENSACFNAIGDRNKTENDRIDAEIGIRADDFDDRFT